MFNLVVSGPGGVGKGTIVEALLALDPSITLSRSWTTRDQRPGESPEAYVFTDRSTFDANIESGGFLEWVEFLDYRQGTPKPEARDEGVMLFEIDVEGARAIAEWDPKALLVFVDTPDRAEQRLRLVQRGDSDETIAKRMLKGDQERKAAQTLGMNRIINDVLEDAVEDLRQLIESARTQKDRRS